MTVVDPNPFPRLSLDPDCRACRRVRQSAIHPAGSLRRAGVWLLCVVILSLSALSVRGQEAPRAAESPEAKTEPDELVELRDHYQHGRYAEALEEFEKVPADLANAPGFVLLRSRCLEAQGDLEPAAKLVADAVAKNPNHAGLLGRFSELQFEQGRYDECQKSINQALEIDDDQPHSRAVLVDLLLATGKSHPAEEASRWFIDFYNRKQPEDAETLVVVARGVKLFALWHPKSQNLNMIVNTLCPDAVKADPMCWQAHAVAGGLLLDKYNRGQGLPELKKALTINPQAATVYARLAEGAIDERDNAEAQHLVVRALEINPNCPPALLSLFDLQFEGGETAAAGETLQKLANINPHNELLLARRALLSIHADGIPTDAELTALFPRLEAEEPIGERCYRQAALALPSLPGPRSSLGLLSMRTGKLDDARKILDEAFNADPFHVRVSNMRKVVKLLDGYETLETEHFRIRYDSVADRMLAHYMSEFLEEQYQPLVKQFRYEPADKTQFEIFHRAKGVSAHQWFSARLVGLPWIQTIGASTGMIVALSSPTAGDRPYNWARVARHEFVHILTLQGTKFNIPHWYTEALAVLSEETPRPELWNEMLRERVPKGQLLNLDTLNQGFTRAKNQNDWNFAYCQARLYAEYLKERFGEDATSQLLEAYREGKTTTQALEQVFQIQQPVFEQGYRDYLDRVVAQLKGEVPEEQGTNLPQAEKAYREQPEDPARAAHYALALLNVNKRKEARRIASAVLQDHPRDPAASLVLARLALRAEDVEQAEKLLDGALDPQRPNPRILELRAEVHLGQKEYAQAAALYELGLKQAPLHVPWQKGLATALLRAKDFQKLKPVLEQLAIYDGDDAPVRRKRAELALLDKDYELALKYGALALQIDVMNADTHEIIARAYAALGRKAEAVKEWERATECKPKDGELVVELARALAADGRKPEALDRLKKLLADDAKNEPAAKLLKELDTP
ncbi:MAG: tetratricopeptide repeat protein [Planctomycetota bacterium]|nr:tetratricopeptide repeat protein [Planctomycetota bacterium]